MILPLKCRKLLAADNKTEKIKQALLYKTVYYFIPNVLCTLLRRLMVWQPFLGLYNLANFHKFIALITMFCFICFMSFEFLKVHCLFRFTYRVLFYF